MTNIHRDIYLDVYDIIDRFALSFLLSINNFPLLKYFY